MLRLFASTVVVFLASSAVLVAAEIKGKITKVDAEKNTITVTIDTKDQEFTLTKDTKIVNNKGKDIKDGLKGKVFQNEKALKKGIAVTLTTEKQGDKDVVTQVKVGGGKKKKNKDQ
jgi:hypothetical protein